MKIREIRIVESRSNWATMLAEDRTVSVITDPKFKEKLETAAKNDISYIGGIPGGEVDGREVVEQLKKADPDPQGKNLRFLANMYASMQFRMEDRERVKTDLVQFKKSQRVIMTKLKEPGNEELASKYPNGIADLLQLKSLNDLYDLVDLAGGEQDVSKRQGVRDIVTTYSSFPDKDNTPGLKKVINTSNFKVYIPETREASCSFKTAFNEIKWCTAGDRDNRYDYYASQGPLYILMAKIGSKLRMWQVQYETGQFMDERDQAINQTDIASLSKISEYTDFLNCLIVKYYGKYLPPEETKGKCKYPV